MRYVRSYLSILFICLTAGGAAFADFGVPETLGSGNAAFRAVAQSPSTPEKFVAVGRYGSGVNDQAFIASYETEGGSVDGAFTGNNGLTGKQAYDFTGAGLDNMCNAIVWASDGYIAACRSMDSSNYYSVYLIKFDASGNLDSSFGTAGIKATGIGGLANSEHGTVRAIAYNPDVLGVDGGVVAIVGPKGTSTAGYKPYLAVYNQKTGALVGAVQTFDTISGTASGVVYDSATQAYYVVSTDTEGNRNLYVNRVYHNTADNAVLKEGTPWGAALSFTGSGAGTDWAPTSVVLQGGNLLIAGGNRADGVTPPWRCAVAAVNTSTGLASTGFGAANVTGGVNDKGVALFSHEGADPTRDCVINAMTKAPVGSDVFLAGSAYNGTNYDAFHMRLTRGGRLVTTSAAPTGFTSSGPGPGDDGISAVTFLGGDPRYLYTLGKSQSVALKNQLLVQRSVTNGFEQSGGFSGAAGFNNSVYATAPATDGSGDVYVGGQFITHGVTSRNYIARINSNGSLDTAFDPGTGFNAAVRSLAPANDGSGDVYVGGEFITFNGGGAVRMARLNSDGTVDAGFPVGAGFVASNLSVVGSVSAIAPAQDGSGDVYVGGQFDSYDGNSRNRLVRLNSDGTLDNGFNVGTGIGTAADDYVAAIIVAADASDIYVVGKFSSYNGTARNGIVRIHNDGTVDTNFNPGTGFSPADARAIVLSNDDSGDVFVGGAFTAYGGASRNYLVRLDEDGAQSSGFSIGTGFNASPVTALAMAADGTGDLYVGGDFTSYNGTSRKALVRLNADGSLDSTFNAGTGPDDDILTLSAALGGYSEIFVGGSFTTFSSVASPYLARISATGSAGTKSAVTVTSVSSDNLDGTYVRGDTIDIKVTFSAAVTGKPQLLLETGTRDAVADYLSGSGTDTLVLRYVVGQGQASGDLDYLSASALLANGDKLVDGTGLEVDPTLPAPGAAGSLGANKALVIGAATAKILYVTSPKVSGVYGLGTNITVQAVFDAPVVVTGTPRIQLETGTTDRNANYTSGSGSNSLVFQYNLVAGDAASDLDYKTTASLTLNGGTIKDGTGAAADLTLPTVGGPSSLAGQKDFVVDTSTTRISHISSTNADGVYSVGDVLDLQVFFNATVNVTGTPTLTLETGDSDATVTYKSGSGQRILVFRYTVASNQSSADLDYSATNALQLNGGTIKNTSSVDVGLVLPDMGTTYSLAGQKSFAILPKVTTVTATNTDGTYSIGDTIGVQVVFTNTVVVTGTPQIKLDVGSGVLVNYTSGSGTSTLLFNYTVASGHETTDLEYRVASILLNGGTVKDTAGRDAVVKFAAAGSTGSLGASKDLVIRSGATASTIAGKGATGGFGSAVAYVGDANFDGYGDYIVGEPLAAAGGTGRGRAYVHSGVDGSLLYTVAGTTDYGKFGFAVGGGGDGNGDGKLDFLVGVPYDTAGGTGRGRVNVYSGANGSKLLSVTGDQDDAHFGWSVAMGGDLNGGGDGDFVVGAPEYDESGTDTGKVFVYSGAGTLIRSHVGPSAGAKFGYSVAIVGDANGDGLHDYAVGAPNTTNGKVYLYSGSDGTLLNTFNGTDPGAKYGYSVSSAGDLNGDGRMDLAIGEPFANAGGSSRGRVSVYNGSSYALITTRSGTDDNGNFGFSVACGGDVNFDGRGDVIVGEPGAAVGGTARGRVRLYSGLTGGQLYSVVGSEDNALLGFAVGQAGDVNGDGFSDLLVGEPFGNGDATDSGKAYLYRSSYVTGSVGPSVVRVTSLSANGTYTTGASLPIKVVFNRPVTVTGTPRLTLETGSSDAVVNYTSGSGTSILTFNYTVGASDVSPDLDYVGTGSLALNGGTIKDADGNDATLTLPAPGKSGSLGSSKAIAMVPRVTSVTSSTADGSYHLGDVISIQVLFASAVTVTGTPKLTLETGATDAAVSYSSGSGTSSLTFNYTVGAGESSSDLNYVSTSSLTLNGGTIKDSGGNDANLTLPGLLTADSLGGGKAISVEGNNPVVTGVTSSKTNGTYGEGTLIPIQISFNAAITVTGTPTLTLETGASDATATYSSGSGSSTLTFNYTVGAGESAADLDYTSTSALALAGGTLKDSSARDAVLVLKSPGASGSLGANKALVVETTRPTVSGVTSSVANATYGVNRILPIQVTFDENVTVTGTPRLTLETGGTDAVLDYASGSGGTTLTFNYTVAPSHVSADLDYGSAGALALNGGTIKDASGNPATLTLAVPGAAGSLGANKDIVIDGVNPAVTNVTSSQTNGTYVVGSVIPIQIVFSDVVIVTGTPTLTLETGTSDAVVNYLSGSGSSTLTFQYTVSAGETSADLDYASAGALALNGGTIQSGGAGNAVLTLFTPGATGSLGANKNLVIDATPPTVTNVTSTKADGNYGVGTSIAIQVVFNEAVTVTGTPRLTLETGASDAVLNYSSGSGSTTLVFNYTVASGESSPDLDYVATNSLVFNGGTIVDAAGNGANLTLASPGAAGSLGANKDLVIDWILTYLVSGAEGGASLGTAVAFIGDVDVDGYVDFAVGEPTAAGGGTARGKVYILSGANGSTLYTLSGTGNSSKFGQVVSGGGDTNVDGRPDFLIGAPYDTGAAVNRGKVVLYSGRTGTIQRTINGPAQAEAHFGASVAILGDVNGDGDADIIVGVPDFDSSGADKGEAIVYDGSSGDTLYTYVGSTINGHFGTSVAAVGDVNGDGYADFAIGEPGTTNGSVYVYSGQDGSVIHTLAGAESGAQFGFSAAGAGDLNGDGRMDILVGEPTAAAGGTNRGKAYVYSGATGSVILTISGTVTNAKLGYAVAGGGDLNRDGKPDVVAGAPFNPGGGSNRGKVFVFSGADGSTLYSVEGKEDNALLGFAVGAGMDFNRDGRADFLVGEPVGNGGSTDSGKAYAFTSGYTSAFPGSPALLWGITGDQAGARLGTSVAFGEDVDLDGKDDFLVGAPEYNGMGRAFVYNGATGSTLTSPLDGAEAGSRFGDAVGFARKANNDGKADYLIGIPLLDGLGTDRGGSILFSGALHASFGGSWEEAGADDDARLGSSVSGAGDVNGDGRSDSLVGSPRANGGGTAKGTAGLFDGATGANLTTFNGTENNSRFGTSVAIIGDVNDDGRPDILVGAPMEGSGAGKAYVYDGSTYASIRSVAGIASAQHGSSVAALGDVNRDGVRDYVVGAAGVSTAYVYSGRDGSVLFTLVGDGPSSGFGASVSSAGDVNADGYADILVGEPQYDDTVIVPGRVQLFSGATGLVLFTITGTEDAARFGAFVSGGGDANHDSRPDFLVGEPDADDGATVDVGKAYLYVSP